MEIISAAPPATDTSHFFCYHNDKQTQSLKDSVGAITKQAKLKVSINYCVRVNALLAWTRLELMLLITTVKLDTKIFQLENIFFYFSCWQADERVTGQALR